MPWRTVLLLQSSDLLMRISLRSEDQHLRASIRALVEDLQPPCSFIEQSSQKPGCEADLELCDYEPDHHSDVNGWDTAANLVLLVQRQHLVRLQEELRGPPVSILLKPVSAAALKALVESRSRGAHGTRTDPGYEQNEADLLQYLLQANLKLQEFDQDRTNFLARAVHDFRAPLTALHGYCGLLVGLKLGSLNPGQIELLERMQHSVKRLSRMASAMFELSVGKHVERKPHLEIVDIEQCVQQALHDVLPLADEKQIALSVQVDRPPIPPFWEAAQIEQVLVNLVENACRFTPRYGSIEVKGYPIMMDGTGESGAPVSNSITRFDSSAVAAYRIDVRDSGPGIAAQFLPMIFEEYTSYSGGKDRSGGGLGLAICRMIVVAHGGTIWAESSTQGAVFSFVLPLHENLSQNGSTSHNIRSLSMTAAG
jgi:signal transduction histidine kinase